MLNAFFLMMGCDPTSAIQQGHPYPRKLQGTEEGIRVVSILCVPPAPFYPPYGGRGTSQLSHMLDPEQVCMHVANKNSSPFKNQCLEKWGWIKLLQQSKAKLKHLLLPLYQRLSFNAIAKSPLSHTDCNYIFICPDSAVTCSCLMWS